MSTESDSDREEAAFHEAGHVVAAVVHGVRFRFSSIGLSDDCESLGRIAVVFPGELDRAASNRLKRDKIDRCVLVFMSGLAAQTKYSGRCDRDGAENDFAAAYDLLSYWHEDESVIDAFMVYATRRARAFVAQPNVWSGIEAVAAALVARTHLKSPEVKRILRASGVRYPGDRMHSKPRVKPSTTRGQCYAASVKST
jgi:hypothetical protein